MSWDFPSVEPPAYLLRLHPDLYREEQERVARRFEEAVRLAEQAFLEEFARLARQLRAVLRRTVLAGESRGPWPVVRFRADASGLTVEACHGEVAVRYHQAGARDAADIAFRGEQLAEIEGRTDTPVSLEPVADGKGGARWTERGLPQVLDLDLVARDRLPAFPPLPDPLHPQPPGFLRALGDAVATAAKDAVRFAVTRLQLRGTSGELIATDGRQLLAQAGFTFPWSDDLLVPALPVFAGKDLTDAGPIAIGRTSDALVLTIGPWTFVLAIDAGGRFPRTETVIPRPSAAKVRLRLDADDAAFLADALPRLPGAAEDAAPVVLELASPPSVWAWSAEGGPVTQLTLARSSVQGVPLRLRMDRHHLRRALRMGFTELQAIDPQQPVCCRDRQRCYVWVPLDPSAAQPPDTEVLHISTMPHADAPATNPVHPRSADPMPSRPSNGNGESHDPVTAQSRPPEPVPLNGVTDLIAETEALRAMLHDACGRIGRLLAALKLQRRQTKAVQQAMASLQQLQLDR